jgi:hypothetical protein
VGEHWKQSNTQDQDRALRHVGLPLVARKNTSSAHCKPRQSRQRVEATLNKKDNITRGVARWLFDELFATRYQLGVLIKPVINNRLKAHCSVGQHRRGIAERLIQVSA